MKKSYAKKFGISKELLERWKSKTIFLEGNKKTLVILVHGWSLTPRQVLPLAKELNKEGYSVNLPKLPGHASRPEDLEGVQWKDWVRSITLEIRKNRRSEKFDKIIIGGTSLGGNVCLLASLKEKVDGIILIGVPVHLKGHFFVKIFSIITPLFRRYIKKRRPLNIYFNKTESYQYFPSSNTREVLMTIRKSIFSLKKITSPILILQTKNDFFVTKYSPWIIYKNVSSKIKEIRWIHTKSENHVPQFKMEVERMVDVVKVFIDKIDR